MIALHTFTVALSPLTVSSGLRPMLNAVSRRSVFTGLAAGAAFAPPAFAFENGIAAMSNFASLNKQPGSPPSDLGLRTRELQRGDQIPTALRACDIAPNCFSTSSLDDPAHLISKWRPPSGSDAMGQLFAVLKQYPPGQAGVDGGGFRVVESTGSYAYVQFESLKYGFIDDVEFALADGDAVQVRSASRLGFLDFAVNAKRLNWISSRLRELGWAAPEITAQSHPMYFGQNDR